MNKYSYGRSPKSLGSYDMQSKPKLLTKKSYGIALFQYNRIKREYNVVVVQKRNTYEYMDFVLRHYNRNDDNRILELFNGMTVDEKMIILSRDFGLMWYKAWLINPESIHIPVEKQPSKQEYDKYSQCKKYYEKAFCQDRGKRLEMLINKSHNSNGKWEIPKGRKTQSDGQSPEMDITCAVREFFEETGITPHEYNLLADVEPKKIITNDNKYRYISYYYIAIANDIFQLPKMMLTDNQLLTEIVDIRLMTINELKVIDKLGQFYKFVADLIKFIKKNYKPSDIIPSKIL